MAKLTYDIIIDAINALMAKVREAEAKYLSNLPPEAAPVKAAFDSILEEAFANELPNLRLAAFDQVRQLIEQGRSPIAKAGTDVV